MEDDPILRRPGGELATRPLHFIWIADCSGSMRSDGKIQALNNAIREAVPHMRTAADENPNAEVLVRAVRFDRRWVSTSTDGRVLDVDPGRSIRLTDGTSEGLVLA